MFFPIDVFYIKIQHPIPIAIGGARGYGGFHPPEDISPKYITMSIFPTHDISLNRYYYSFYSYNPSEDANVIKSFTYDNTQTLVETKDISFNTKSPTEMITFLENSGTNPYAVGKSGAADFRSMDLAFGGVYKKGFKETQRQALMTYLNTTYKNIHAGAVQEYAVTVSNPGSGNKYYLDGNGPAYTVFAPTSGIYVFDQSDSTNVTHPLVIGETDGAGTYYSSMITEGTIGSLNGYTIVDISAGTPDLYYYCNVHSGMGGQILNFMSATSYTVTVVYSATYGWDIYQVAELPNYYTDELGLIFNVGTRYMVDVSSLSNTYIPVFGTTNDNSSSIVYDTSIVNRVGDIIYVSPQQTLYMFNQANIHMTIPPIIYKNYKLRTSGQLTLNITTDSVVNMYLINGGGGGGRGSSSNSGHGGNGGSKYQRNNQSLVAGIYNIQVGPGATGGNSIQTQNDGGSSNYTKITYPDNTVYQTSGTGNTYGGSSRQYGNGWNGANGILISNFGAGGGSGSMITTESGSGGSGGNFGGGKGGAQSISGPTAGAANTGSGGGGGGKNQNGAKGGSGVFYIKLPANKFSYTGSYVEVTNFGD